MNLVVFQFNPEELRRSFSPWVPSAGEGSDEAEGSDRAQPFDPGETISINELRLHAADDLEEPGSHPVTVVSGVADRLAALEMLLYPAKGDGGLSVQVSASASLSGGGVEASASAAISKEEVKRKEVPLVLFAWGPGRIVPVRLTSVTITEQLFSPTLYPIQATVAVDLSVLTPEALKSEEGSESLSVELAKTAYEYTRTQKEGLAAANVANAVDSALGMLPF